MRKVKFQYKKIAAALATFFVVSSCSDSFLDINTDPNNPSEASLQLMMPAIQTGYSSALLRNVERASAAIVDQVHSASYGRWRLTEADFNNAWKGLYTQSLADIKVVIEQAEESNQRAYAGIAKLQKAYIYSVLTDLWGDVPYEEALVSENPVYESGAEIYPKLFALIDEGIADLNAEGAILPEADMIYGGDKSLWIRMGKSLKLKMFLQTRLLDPATSASGIQAILNEGDIINSNTEDFQFLFGTGIAPQNAHPYWIADYSTAGSIGYTSNSLFVKMLAGSVRRPDDYNNLDPDLQYGVRDPRLRYYFYRQVGSLPEGHASIPCELNQIGCYYYYTGNGYLGRDRGDNSVGPADGAERTLMGVYPAGGLMDQDQFQAATVNHGTGAGVFPMITNFMMKFAIAESILTLDGVAGDARAYLEAGTRASVQKVLDFGDQHAAPDAKFKPSEQDIENYVAGVLAKYDAADEAGKLEIVIDQAYVATFGNGIEAYNNYRRTGYPTLTPVVDNNEAGPFPNRFVYVVDEVGSNRNVPKDYSVTKPVFWAK